MLSYLLYPARTRDRRTARPPASPATAPQSTDASPPALECLSELQTPPRDQASLHGITRSIMSDLKTAGVTKLAIAKELTRGLGEQVANWGATLCLVGFGLQAAAEGSPTVFLYIAGWIALSQTGSWCDRSWRTRMDEHDRAYGRVLDARLLRTQGQSTISQLEDPDRQGQMELHHSRRDSISNLVETTVALPADVLRLCLSAGALLAADWRVALALPLAVLPSIIIKHRQIKEDLELEERQSKREKVIDTISDEAYAPHGSVRMILGRFTNRIAQAITSIQHSLDSERNAHERSQTRKCLLADALYFTVLGTSMTLLYSQYQEGAFGIGVLGFLWLQLVSLGQDLDNQGETFQAYGDLAGKVRRFYQFTAPSPTLPRAPFPKDHTVILEGVRYVRGEHPEQFVVTAPEIELTPGSFLLIRGASGAGKTTLQQRLAFGSAPQEGAYLIGGVPVDRISLDDWLSHVAYCGPVSALQRGLTVRELLSLGGEQCLPERLAHPLVRELVESLAGNLGLDTRIGAGLPNGREFSSGELQRLNLVTALVPARPILFLDEVTSNQSEDFLKTIEEELSSLRSKGTTVILVTHSKRFDGMASHIMRISKGLGEMEFPKQVVEDDPSKEARLPSGSPPSLVFHPSDGLPPTPTRPIAGGPLDEPRQEASGT